MKRHASTFQRRSLAIALALIMGVTALAQPTLGTPAQTAPGAAVPASPCAAGSGARLYHVTALPLPISYNHWGDMDLQGKLFLPREHVDPVLDDVSRKLGAAGLDELAAPLLDMRAALAADDVDGATDAARRFVVAATRVDGSMPPHSRVDQTDLVQPLVLRAHVGDCVAVNLTNIMPEPVSFHVHAAVTPPGAGEALGVQAPDYAAPGTNRTYRMFFPDMPGMEGAHFLHSHVDARDQTRHGLFGAIAVQPKGTAWVSTADGVTPAPYGLEAMIVSDGANNDFREFIKIYHDEVELVDWQLQALPEISPYGEYGPGTKAINLRSEPFMDRFKHHDQLEAQGILARGHDKSQSYGSYTYGDPSTWIQKSYLGDPVKFRMINAGPGQHHIHHLHGGGIRWRSTPLAEPNEAFEGPSKFENNGAPSASQRLDVQNAGPGESFNLEPEAGTGGVQRSAGDFLYHCHIAEHYLAGMWGIWRAFNTLQPDVAELPDRVGTTQASVNSLALLGHVLPDGTVLDGSNLHLWVESFLPAKGKPGEEDASVWDWEVQQTPAGPLYFGEPETAHVWPTYPADAPGRLPAGTRPEIMFDPVTAKPAYPMLRPHLGARPPFAPDHGGAPWLKHTVTEQNPGGLCPANAPSRRYDVVAMQANVSYNRFDFDERGQVFALAHDVPGIASGATDPASIVLRANAGDCVDVTLTSTIKEKEAADYTNGIHSKTNIHIHLVQFDVQGSDGVVAGYNFETTLRSLDGAYNRKPGLIFSNQDRSVQVVTKVQTATGSFVVDPVLGETRVKVDRIQPFLDRTGAPKVNSTVGLGLGLATIESLKLKSVDAGAREIVLHGVPQHPHGGGEFIGYEFVRYQWYPDVELGIVYFHDHVNGIDTWRHGLFGSLIVEPAGSKWLPPKRVTDDVPMDATSHVVDIVRNVSGDQAGRSFREIVVHFQDRACVEYVNGVDCLNHQVPLMPDRIKEPAGFNLRSEPLHRRDPEHPFWSLAKWAKDDPRTPGDERLQLQGDPSTDTLEAYPGDGVVIRFLYTGQSMSRGVGTFGVTGHRFQAEQFLEGSRTVDTMSAAVSSQHNFEFECGAGGCQRLPGDYMYYMTQPEYLDRGAWGLIRVHPPTDLSKVRPLPDNLAPTAGEIPTDKPVVRFNVSAIRSVVAHNPNLGITSTMKRFVLDEDLPIDPLTTDAADLTPPDPTPPEPLVLRVAPETVVEVQLTNRMPTGVVGLHAGLLSAGPDGQGINVGNGPNQVVRRGHSIVYRWYADRELGVADLVSLASPGDAGDGLVGAIVVEPAGVGFSSATGASALLDLGNGVVAREHVLIFASPDAQFESSTMPYVPDVAGLTLVNFATEPLARRTGMLLPQIAGVLPEPARSAATTALPAFSGASVDSCHIDTADCLGRAIDIRNPGLMVATAGLAPWTPIIEATKDQPVVIRALGGSGDQLAVFHLDGHYFASDPEMESCRTDLRECKSNLLSTVTLGPREVRNIWIDSAGPGGAGDYMYRNHRDPYFEAGAWGILRVSEAGIEAPVG